MKHKTVCVRFLTPLRLAVNTPFPFYDLPALLRSFSPVSIDISFTRLDTQSSAVDVAITFDDAVGLDGMAKFKESLIRSEVELAFECIFYPDAVTLFDESNRTGVEIRPDVLMLPTGEEVAFPISLMSIAVDLLRQGAFMGSAISYRVTLERARPDRDMARALVPALAKLQKNSYVADLEQAIRTGFDLLGFGGWSARERISIPRIRAAIDRPWIESLIRQGLNNNECRFLPEELLPLAWDAAPLHAGEESLQQVVASLRAHDFIDRLFQRIVPSDPDQNAITRSLSDARRVWDRGKLGNYAFISYARANSDFAKRLLLALDAARVRYWYDAGIHAGTYWDDELERRIRDAGVMIACVSNEFQDSKYCKRELKFADLLNKAILPIAPSKWTWGPGLQMMFQELQVASFDNSHEFNQFRVALKSAAPQVFCL